MDSGLGGHPGINELTFKTLDNGPANEGESLYNPPLTAQAPTAITLLGSAIWLYIFSNLEMFCLFTIPVTNRISACFALDFSSIPNLVTSYFGLKQARHSKVQPLQPPQFRKLIQGDFFILISFHQINL